MISILLSNYNFICRIIINLHFIYLSIADTLSIMLFNWIYPPIYTYGYQDSKCNLCTIVSFQLPFQRLVTISKYLPQNLSIFITYAPLVPYIKMHNISISFSKITIQSLLLLKLQRAEYKSKTWIKRPNH